MSRASRISAGRKASIPPCITNGVNLSWSPENDSSTAILYRPRLLSDNGSAYISKELKQYLEANEIHHIRTRPYPPMTQGKIERYHRSMKNLILLDHYYSPSELEERIREWINYYNNHRYHEAIDNITPRDKYFGRDKEILKNRMKIKKQTIQERKKINKMLMLESLPNGIN